ncbi:hypothetical protein HK098_004129 [Nowakowskiella sp. JEL0407]|nr:hypothetical protein HK098_004129 [Nowakowskiella sp. JEL0407]
MSSIESKKYDIFISYRQSACKDVAEKLYLKLIAKDRSLNVFRDSEAIPKGVRWKKFFTNALADTRIFVPLISKETLNTFKNSTSRDNLLLEWNIALTYEENDEIIIIPIFVLENGQDRSVFAGIELYDVCAADCALTSKQLWSAICEFNGSFVDFSIDNDVYRVVDEIIECVPKFTESELNSSGGVNSPSPDKKSEGSGVSGDNNVVHHGNASASRGGVVNYGKYNK